MSAPADPAAPLDAVLAGLSFRLPADRIAATTDAIVSAHTDALDAIVAHGSQPRADASAQASARASAGEDSSPGFAVFQALADADADAVTTSSQVTLPALTSTDAAAREASTDAKRRLREMWEKAYSRKDLYDTLRAAAASITAADAEHTRFVAKTLAAFEQRGCTAADAVRKEYATLSHRCGQLASEYEQAINEDTSTAELTADDLRGCPAPFLDSLPRAQTQNVAGPDASDNDDSESPRFAVSMKAPTRVPVMQYAESEECRRRVQRTANLRCVAENEPRLAKLVAARMAKAALLGHSCHAEQVLQQKMVGSLAAAKKFLLDIHAKLQPAAATDRQALEELKAERTTATEDGASRTSPLCSWDGAYYARILKERRLALDPEKVREFFPMKHVQEAIFRVYQRMLGVTFSKVSPEAAGDAIWHEEVDLYSVHDAESQELCGHFYLDLFSRDGKFGHQCVVPIVPSCCRPSGGDGAAAEQRQRQFPACAILGNMTRPTQTRPSLLRFAEVHTFFHEFGHVMHAVLSRTRFTRFSWTWPMMPWPGGVEQDFLEVPSMFLEKLVYDADVIAELSCHFETGERLDAETVGKLNAAQHFLAARRWSRFIAMAIYDLEVHSQNAPYTYNGISDLNLRGLWAEVMAHLAGANAPLERVDLAETFMPASWCMLCTHSCNAMFYSIC